MKYRKNEAFVDVIEDVNLLMSAGGELLSQDLYLDSHSLHRNCVTSRCLRPNHHARLPVWDPRM